MKKLIAVLLFFGWTVVAQEHGGGHGADSHGIPWDHLGVQAFNFVILVSLLIYLLKKAVSEHFEQRLKGYADLVQRAERAKAEAEKSHREISERFRQLESTADQSIQQARAEAEELKRRMVDEAKALSQRLEEEARRSASLEIEKAKSELRKELLARALDSSTDDLKKNLGSSEQQRLQKEFVEKIQVVRG